MVYRDLAEINQDLVYTSKHLEKAKNDLELCKYRVRSTEMKLGEIQSDFNGKRVQLKQRLVQIYSDREVGFLDLLFASSDVMNIVNASYYFEKVIGNDVTLIKNLQQEYKYLNQERKRLHQEKQKVFEYTTEIAQKQQDLAVKQQRKQEYIESLRREIAQYERNNAELLRTSSEIADLIRSKGATKYMGTGRFLRPAEGWLSSPFGYRRHPIFRAVLFHTGVDFAAPSGSRIVAADTGEVIFTGYKGGYGKATIIDHGGGFTTVYAHQSRIVVQRGQRVIRGQLIGYVGSTGYSTGPHLHFEVRRNGEPTDPMKYLH